MLPGPVAGSPYFVAAAMASKGEMRPGDHIYALRASGLHEHHGIYVGEDDCEVIHFYHGDESSSAGARVTTLEDFCDGSPVRVVLYGDSSWKHYFWRRRGTSHILRSDPADVVIRRAKDHLTQQPERMARHSAASNICEGFAVECKTGWNTSLQVWQPTFSEPKRLVEEV